jgi:hypothetical protein
MFLFGGDGSFELLLTWSEGYWRRGNRPSSSLGPYRSARFILTTVHKIDYLLGKVAGYLPMPANCSWISAQPAIRTEGYLTLVGYGQF